MREQEICPISRQLLDANIVTFDHEGVRFDASMLHGYLLAVPGATNPVNRLAFQKEHVDALNALFPDSPKALAGEAAEEARRTSELAASTLRYLEEEVKESMATMARMWYADEDTYEEACFKCRQELMQCRRDILSLHRGADAWYQVEETLIAWMRTLDPPPDVFEDMVEMLDNLCTPPSTPIPTSPFFAEFALATITAPIPAAFPTALPPAYQRFSPAFFSRSRAPLR